MPKPKYCWDSCVLIAILTGDRRDAGEVQGLRDAMDQVDRDEVVLITSVLIRTEVLEFVVDIKSRNLLQEFLLRSNVVGQPVTSSISEMAGRIRATLRPKEIKLKTPDAIFVATAIVHRCDALYTYDQGLLRLSGRPVVNGLKITIPSRPQLGLRL